MAYCLRRARLRSRPPPPPPPMRRPSLATISSHFDRRLSLSVPPSGHDDLTRHAVGGCCFSSVRVPLIIKLNVCQPVSPLVRECVRARVASINAAKRRPTPLPPHTPPHPAVYFCAATVWKAHLIHCMRIAMSSGSTVAPPHRRSPGGASR